MGMLFGLGSMLAFFSGSFYFRIDNHQRRRGCCCHSPWRTEKSAPVWDELHPLAS